MYSPFLAFHCTPRLSHDPYHLYDAPSSEIQEVGLTDETIYEPQSQI